MNERGTGSKDNRGKEGMKMVWSGSKEKREKK